MCCSTAAKITFNLYVTQPECYVWYEIRKDAVCSWVLDRELMTCPASEPSDMIASMPHLPFPTLFPLLTKWRYLPVRWLRSGLGGNVAQEPFKRRFSCCLRYGCWNLDHAFHPTDWWRRQSPAHLYPQDALRRGGAPSLLIAFWAPAGMLVASVGIGWSQGPLNKSVVIWRRRGEGLPVCILAFELIHL